MSRPTRIHSDKAPHRLHFIEEWAKRRGFKKAAHLAAELDVDKSQVSRWYKGQIPRDDMLDRIAAAFQLDDVRSLFRHPDDDWLSRLFADSAPEDQADLKELITIWKRRKAG